MERPEGHRINAVETGSIAAELGLQPGDFLLRIDGQPLTDIFDYRLRQLKDSLLLTVSQQGVVVEYDIEKDEDEDLGLSFTNPMLQDCTECDNHCIFCFIDQLPPGMRSSLYFKDDDLRLSFLSGNYATLTNLSDEALDRLIGYRFSPMNVSVHTTNPTLRRKMICHREAGNILARLQRIAAAGLQINCQIVLCPGVNDGIELERTLADLIALGPPVGSIALVPVGITRYRHQNRLYPIRPYLETEAAEILHLVDRLQHRLLQERGTRLVYAADEFYLKAGITLPAAGAYEDFPQLENGVGMASAMLADLERGLSGPILPAAAPVWQARPALTAAAAVQRTETVVIVTGTAAAPLFEPYRVQMTALAGCPVQIMPVKNVFFGETVTVAGLTTGRDIIEQLQPIVDPLRTAGRLPLLLLPASMFKADEAILLDDVPLQQLSDRLAVPVWVGRPDGLALAGLLKRIRQNKGDLT
jgi:putative radical SAM enzyme (TIGR03279 family)